MIELIIIFVFLFKDKIANSSGDTFTMRTVDKSMKFVTATIQGLRKWSKYREQVPLVFEIFGKHVTVMC